MLDAMTPAQFEEWMDSDALDRTVTGGRQLVKTVANIGEWMLILNGIDTPAWKLIDGEEEPNTVQSSARMLDAMRATVERHNASA